MMGSGKARRLSAANFEIMKILWAEGEMTVAEVLERINAKRKNKVRRTTVQVQMKRLEDYGWLEHREEGRTYYYRAVREREEAVRNMLVDIKNRIFGGSYTEFVKCLFDDADIPPEEIEHLRRTIDSYRRDKR